MMNLFEVAKEISDRLTRIFLRDSSGRRPVYGGTEKFQQDPHWRDHILFYEYFHGDNGAGLGASHQTGWTGLVATLIHFFGRVHEERLLGGGKEGAVGPRVPLAPGRAGAIPFPRPPLFGSTPLVGSTGNRGWRPISAAQ